MKKLIFLILFFSLISCVNEIKNTNQELNSELDIYNKDDCCKKSTFYKIIEDYLFRKDILFNEFKMYYSVYFFDKEDLKYFTIWTSNSHPNYIEYYNKKNKYRYVNFFINEELVYILTNIDDIDLSIIKCCESVFNHDTILIEDYFTYDGPLYSETYKYYYKDDSVVLEKLAVPILDFLGDVPKKFY